MLKKWVGKGELDYERYLHTGTLLSLQSPEGELVSHDELMFQIVHQSQELYLKLASREMVEVVAELDRDALWAVSARLVRVQKILSSISAEMSILETMTPAEYQVIRRSLGNGSGQESPGYNTLRHAADGLESAMERMLARRGLTLFQVYSAGGPKDLQHVCEQLVTVDECFQGWLYAHYQLVRRTIGIDRTVKALDGLPSQVLQARMNLPLFRALWDVRVELTAGWKREGGYAPGESRTGGGCPMAAINAMNDAAMNAPVAQAAPMAHAAVAQAQAANAAVAQAHHVPVAAYAQHAAAVAHAAPAQAQEARTGGGCPMHAMNGQHAPAAHAPMAHAPVAHAAAAHSPAPHAAAVHASAAHSPAPHAHSAAAHAAPAHASDAHAATVHAPAAHAATAHAHEARAGGCPMHAQHAPAAHAATVHAPHALVAHAQPAPVIHAPHAAPHAPTAHAAHAPVPHAPAPHAALHAPTAHAAHAPVPHAPAPHAAAAPAPVAHAAHAPAPHGPHTHPHAAHALAYAHAQELRSQS
ncbi:tryptophan 2,3-dioxygenase family protein [Corallococcus sp. EGB]|uniref:tryptophan 2,3-dioxygenase family protein n=1 Tax=Corallococcus sp. EGB TaxID=1521117 RepID=UPI001CBBDE88|nr:tryptophan 2,3-dioxygenase family protein [Corallococcus sp. EGB]